MFCSMFLSCCHAFLIANARDIAQEIATLRKEALAFKAVRAALRAPDDPSSSNAAKLVFEKVRCTYLCQSSCHVERSPLGFPL